MFTFNGINFDTLAQVERFCGNFSDPNNDEIMPFADMVHLLENTTDNTVKQNITNGAYCAQDLVTMFLYYQVNLNTEMVDYITTYVTKENSRYFFECLQVVHGAYVEVNMNQEPEVTVEAVGPDEKQLLEGILYLYKALELTDQDLNRRLTENNTSNHQAEAEAAKQAARAALNDVFDMLGVAEIDEVQNSFFFSLSIENALECLLNTIQNSTIKRHAATAILEQSPTEDQDVHITTGQTRDPNTGQPILIINNLLCSGDFIGSLEETIAGPTPSSPRANPLQPANNVREP